MQSEVIGRASNPCTQPIAIKLETGLWHLPWGLSWLKPSNWQYFCMTELNVRPFPWARIIADEPTEASRRDLRAISV